MANDSMKTRRTLTVGNQEVDYFSMKVAEGELGDLSKLPKSLKILLENLLRHEDGRSVTVDDIKALAGWLENRRSDREIAYRPARVLMQDFTGVPAVVDLAAMRAAIASMGGDAQRINPLSPVDLVIDHSVMVDNFGTADSLRQNVALEYDRNRERYEFLRWGSGAFDNFRVVPPGTGICHQVNLEYLARVAWTKEVDGRTVVYPDTLVGTDSHTTMVNGLGVLGWGVGGIEAEAAMLGQPVSMLIPEVVGFKLTGSMREGNTATDVVLTVTEMLRQKGVVGKFVEFYGPGVAELSLADRATIANMAPEYGATCGFFPVDDETCAYMRATGRPEELIDLVEQFCKAQGLWRDDVEPSFTDTLELDISSVEPSIAGPKRPQDRIRLADAHTAFATTEAETYGVKPEDSDKRVAVAGTDYSVGHGDVMIAAITSCTNTSNPGVMLGAGLVARNAVAKGLKVKPWVKTSLAPGSQVVEDYMAAAGLTDDMDALGFNLVGFGCTTCIGNSGPLPEPIANAVTEGDLVSCSVLSGNRNFEGRVNPHVQANYLASPPLVVAYAIAGSLKVDIMNDPLGQDQHGNDVYLRDIWPSNQEVTDTVRKAVLPEMFTGRYGNVFDGDADWQAVQVEGGETYNWDATSTYVQNPPYFDGMPAEAPEGFNDIEGARVLAVLGDSVTTDHISPAGSIKQDGPAGTYLAGHQVPTRDFNSYGSRRGNHEVMMRGTFANIRIRNEMVPGTEGGETRHVPSGDPMSIYDAAMQYADEGTPLVVIGGKEYGTGSSRDWAAKGTKLLGVKAVVVESFERIHRSNLVGMGVLPLQFKDGQSRKSLNLTGEEVISLTGLSGGITPRMDVTCTITRPDGSSETVDLLCRIDTLDEVDYYRHGGILNYVLRRLAA